MGNFEALLQSINGKVAQNFERITEHAGSAIAVGGWIARWGSWQIFKHNLSSKFSIVRAVAVSVGDEAPDCKHEDSTVCITHISGESVLYRSDVVTKLYSPSIIIIPPNTRFRIDPVDSGSEFVMVTIPPTVMFDGIPNAVQLDNILGLCEASDDQ